MDNQITSSPKHTHNTLSIHTPFTACLVSGSPPPHETHHPPGHGMLGNQLEALNLGLVCHMVGRWVKDNSVVLSDSLVLLVLHEVYICMGNPFVGWQDQLEGTLTLTGLHHTGRARAAAISYTTKDKSSVVHYQAHHTHTPSTHAHTQTHTHT